MFRRMDLPAATVAAALVLACLPAPASADVYWSLSISDSDTECWQTSGTPFTGDRTLYLTMCGGFDRAMEFGLESTYEEIVSFTPSAGVDMQGTLESMILCVSTPMDPLVVATVVVRDTDGSGGSLCFVPSDRARICHAGNCSDQNWTNEYWATQGYSSDPAVPLCFGEITDCGPNPVERSTWGRTKGGYR
jgi:hypothetical protein